MSRPGDWHVLDLDHDPTPGDPYWVGQLAQKLLRCPLTRSTPLPEVRRLAGENGVVDWLGEAGAAFGSAVGELPGQLDKLDASYGIAGIALRAFAGDLETAQTQADEALARGREALARLASAEGEVETASATVATNAWSLAAASDTATYSTYSTSSPIPAAWSGEPSLVRRCPTRPRDRCRDPRPRHRRRAPGLRQRAGQRRPR